MNSENKIGLARQARLLFIKSLPVDCRFNIIRFGSRHESLFYYGSPPNTIVYRKNGSRFRWHRIGKLIVLITLELLICFSSFFHYNGCKNIHQREAMLVKYFFLLMGKFRMLMKYLIYVVGCSHQAESSHLAYRIVLLSMHFSMIHQHHSITMQVLNYIAENIV